MCVESSGGRPRGAPGMKLARLAGGRKSGCAKELISVFQTRRVALPGTVIRIFGSRAMTAGGKAEEGGECDRASYHRHQQVVAATRRTVGRDSHIAG